MTTSPRFRLFNTGERLLRCEPMDQAFQVGIWLPFSYPGDGQTYPVLYMPDAEFVFGMAASLVPTLIGEGEIPELLVVGVGYDDLSGWAEFGELRDRDLCPPGFQKPPISRLETYIDFYRDTLFPLIETEYHGSPEKRGLFGFSSGGLFSCHTFLTRPGMFRRVLAASCTWPGADAHLLHCEEQFAAQPDHSPADLYLTVGEREAQQLPGFQRVVERLEARSYPGLRFTYEILAGEGHSSGTLAKTFLNGLRTVYGEGKT